MQQDMPDAKPDIVVIYIGVNDVWRKSLSGTVARTLTNLKNFARPLLMNSKKQM
jgi:lysophospholipase L1-like esterase